ncbi:MAG: GNAT family N-acetyltransferase [Chitinispirillales bacterium]|jgi:Leu/Phe-tRNA-protein transferase|nr:GNAT family N-acetyltransferase [Chitinispirillales bacterium]
MATEIKYTESGHIFITPSDDCREIVDAILETDYSEEFCLATAFEPDFIAKLMEAGFLVMSANISEDAPFYVLLPKLHYTRSALFYENLHVKRTARRFLNRYELKADADFDDIVDRCVKKHGTDWLTPPLVDCVKKIRRNASANHPSAETLSPVPYAYPASFALYRDGKLAAGEFGVVCGKVYTSYSGFYEEDNAGTVQLVKTVKYLQENGFSFFDMGMPLNYKTALGATDIGQEEFVGLFRGI